VGILSKKQNMIKILKDNFSWLKDIAVVSGIAILLFLNAHYVTIDKFESSEKSNEMAHQAIQTTLVNIDKTLALQAQNQDMLISQQKQIVINTTRLTEIEARLKFYDAIQLDTFIRTSLVKYTELDARIKNLEIRKN
jgi:hypothetical protein